ncbi:Haloalkane dehalogenase [Paraconexibacter sp. AEG42_29]|uniref:Haloalkane dehalogenase n=1 Tax=Paraconexibacter sp. AEG42_29 TaxID=2997339 RepID=A0AAU7AT10_9ACTN
MPEVTLRQGTIHHRETAGDGPPVVFVHGFLVDHRLWGRVQDELERRGVRSYAPDLPLGAHPHAMSAAHVPTPRGVARLLLDWLAAHDLTDVTLVGNDTGGAICQFALDTDPSRIGRVVLTNCDAFDRFPPPPFDAALKVARLPGVLLAGLQAMRSGWMRDTALGFGVLTERPLPRELTGTWVRPCLTDRGVRRDTVAFLRAVDARELLDVSTRLHTFAGPVRLCWAPADRYFRVEDARRLRDAFADATLVEIPDSRTFVALDQPQRLADEIAAFGATATALTAAAAGPPAQAGSSSGAMAPAGM